MYNSSTPQEFSTLQTVLAHMPGVVYQLRQDTAQSSPRLSYISDNCPLIFGLSQAQMLADETLFLDCMHPSDRASLQMALAESGRTMQGVLWTGRILQPSGLLQWAQSTAQPSLYPDKTFTWNGLLSLVLPPLTPHPSVNEADKGHEQDRRSEERNKKSVSCARSPLLNLYEEGPQHPLGNSPQQSANGPPIVDVQQQANQVLEHKVAERTSQLNQTIELLLEEVVERSHAEQDLHERETFLHSIYHNVRQAIFVVDIDEAQDIRFSQLNPACEEAFGIKSVPAQGKTPEDLLGEALGLRLRQHYKSCLDQEKPIVFEELIPRQASARWWLTQLTPLKHEDGTIYSILGNAIDITAQKQVETTLKKRDRLLQGAAMANRHLLTQPNLYQAIYGAVAAFGEATGVHHIYLLERPEPQSLPTSPDITRLSTTRLEAAELDITGLDAAGNTMQLFCEWGSQGTPVQDDSGMDKNEGEHASLEHDAGEDEAGIFLDQEASITLEQGRRDWYASLTSGNTILSSVEELPSSMRDYFLHYGVRSILVEPIEVDQEQWGCIVFEDCLSEEAWSNSEQSIFRTLAENIGGAIARHYVEAELLESTQLLQLVMDNIPQAVFWKDLNSVYLGCNVTFAEAAGIEHTDQIIGKTDHDLCWTEEEAELYRQNDQYVMSTDTPLYHVIEPQRHLNGDEILCDVNKIPLHDLDENVVGILGTFEDITERQKAENALRESEAKLREQTEELQTTLQELQRTQSQLIQSEKMSSLGQLVAGVAHEINNPVNFIYGNVNHANEYALDLLHVLNLYEHYASAVPAHIQAEIEETDLTFLKGDFPKLLDSMKVGAVRIRNIVSSLRTFSRMDEAERKVVDIHEGIDSTLMILQSRLKQSPKIPQGVQVNKNYDSIPSVECFAGPLNQVFMNLVSNAIDALEDAVEFHQESQQSFQPSLTISTSLEDVQEQGDRDVSTASPGPVPEQPQSGGTLCVTITDNALGIPESIQSRLFDPFFTTKPVGRGTGMGLSISYQIVTERHRGTLSCSSTQGQGTTFTIKIPLNAIA